MVNVILTQGFFFFSPIVMNVTGPEERYRSAIEASAIAPFTRQSGHSLGDVMEKEKGGLRFFSLCI